MRKYHQLALVIGCTCSLILLFIYKSENNRLKDVLQVVNFFGRKDASFSEKPFGNATHVDEFYNAAYPLPVWSSIGHGFHAYGAYWSTKESIAGGEAHAIVVGRQGSIVNYRCLLIFNDRKRVAGKFRFHQIDTAGVVEYKTYWFSCTLSRSVEMPKSVVFKEANAKEGNEVKLHTIMSKANRNLLKSDGEVSICLNMVEFKLIPDSAHKNSLLQFFLYHEIIGIKKVLVYNSDALPVHIQQLLRKTNLKIHYFPFNFPFAIQNTSRIHEIIRTDCIMRNLNNAQYTLLLRPNEFVYPGTKLSNDDSITRSLNKYPSEVTQFEIVTFPVCLDNKKQMLMDNFLYDPQFKYSHQLYIDRTDTSRPLPFHTASDAERLKRNDSVAIPLSKVIAHCYVECAHNKDGLSDWRTLMTANFMNQFAAFRYELDYIM